MYIGTTINESPVIAGRLGSDIKGDPAFLTVKFDANGDFVLSGAGEAAVGIIIPGCGENLSAGDEITVQIKDCAIAKTGAAVAKGDALATDANGKLIKAVAGTFIFGYAISSSDAPDGTVEVQISKSGYCPAAN